MGGVTEIPWWRVFVHTGQQFQRHQLTDQAAALTYFSVLSLFPALIALVALLGVFGDPVTTTNALLDLITELGQADTAEQLRGPIEGMITTSGAGLTLAISVLTAIWSASGYVGAFGRAMNRMYGVDEGRPIWTLKPTQLVLTVVTITLAALVLVGLVVSGDVAAAVGNVVGLGSTMVAVWGWVKWPVMLLIVAVTVAVLYRWTPNVKVPRWRYLVSPGAVLAVLVWALASVGFGVYVSYFSSYNKTYGSLAGVIVFLLWVWITNNALLLGAQFNVEVIRRRQLHAGIPAEEQVQVEPRDTRQSTKLAEQIREEVTAMRRVRLEHSGPDAVTEGQYHRAPSAAGRS